MGKEINKEYVVKRLYDMLTGSQKELYSLYYKNNRDKSKAAGEWKETRGIKTDKAGITRYFDNQKILSLIIDITDDKEDEKIDNPTLEWTLSEMMKLYKHTDKEFNKVEKMIQEGDGRKELVEARDKYKREKKELLKQITDFQNKFGEMLNNDSINISLMGDKEFVNELKTYVMEAESYLQNERWFMKKREIA